MNTLNDNSEPIFIICNARSESFLLRSILDRHESIGYLPELDLCGLILEIKDILERFEGGFEKDSDVIQKPILLDTQKYVDQLVRSQLKKAIWCEQSIFMFDHLKLMSNVFPEARYVFLLRHSMEFLRTALEKSKYGIDNLGFDNHVRNSSHNIVDAIAKFWCENMEKVLEFEKSECIPTFRIKYEDILNDTDRTLGDLFGFLELGFDASLLDNIFSNKEEGIDDSKNVSIDKIKTDNFGNDRTVPVGRIEDETFEQMNHLLSELNYETVDRNWGIVNERNSTETVANPNDVEMIVEFITERLNGSTPPESIKEEILELNIQGIDTSPWLIDFSLGSFSKGPDSPKKPTVKVDLNISTTLEILNNKQSVMVAMKDGRMMVDGDPQMAHFIARYFFLGTSVL